MKTVLIIDDDPVVTTLLKNLLEKSGYNAITTKNGEEGLRLTRLKSPDLVITDFEMPGMSGLDVLQELVSQFPGLPIIMLTCHSDVSLTIKSIQAGAYDYIEKPIQPKKMLDAIRNGIQVSEQSRNIEEKVPVQVRKLLEDNILAGKTARIREIVKNIGRISTTRMPVLIQGEPGTGKTEVANLIHYSGITKNSPLKVLHCDTMLPDKVDEELIGYHSDAFDRKRRTKEGLLINAADGSILIHEFQLLPMTTQLTLSRILDQQLVHMPGLTDPIPFKARIIVTIGHDPEVLLKEGRILPELYYQLKVFSIQLPPLRSRIEDLEELTSYYLEKQNRKLAKSVRQLEQGTFELLMAHSWPGNLRELENAISQAIILSRGDVLEKEHLRMYLQKEKSSQDTVSTTGTLEEIERVYIQKVLQEVGWRKGDAAVILGISRPTLNAKIERYGLREHEG